MPAFPGREGGAAQKNVREPVRLPHVPACQKSRQERGFWILMRDGGAGWKNRDAARVCSASASIPIAVLAKRQQAMDHAATVKHIVLVLPNKQLIRQGYNRQPTKIIMGQFYHLFDMAVIRLEVGRIFHKIYFELQCVSHRSVEYFRYMERSVKKLNVGQIHFYQVFYSPNMSF